MLTIIGIDLIVIVTLISIIATRGLECALPAFVFFVTLLPEECRLPMPGLFDLYTRRLALGILLVAFICLRRKPVVRRLPLKHLLLIHTLWVLVSTVCSIVLITSVKQVMAQIVEYYLIYYICVKTISDDKTVKRMALAMVFAVTVACSLGLLEVYAKWSILSIFPAELQLTYGNEDGLYGSVLDRGIRARSVFTHPILFGGAISMMVPIAIYFISSADSLYRRMCLGAALFLMFWNLYKTSSRGPWLATALSLAILLVMAGAKVRRPILMLGAFAVCVLIARPGIAETLWNIYRATMDPTSTMGYSYQYRPILLHTVLHTLNTQPVRALVGFGLGSFREKGLILVIPGIETHRWFTCDSAWILFMYETGYIGFVLVALLLLYPVVLVIRSYRQLTRRARHFCVVCVSSMTSFFFVMLSVAAYAWGQNGHMLWMLIAMTVAYLQIMKRKARVTLTEQRSAAYLS